jgi:phosphatidylserine decarboxylase
MRERLFIVLQYLLPRLTLTRIVHWLARIRVPAVKNFLIRRFIPMFDVDTSELARDVPDGFVTFNDFFTRELADGARPIADVALVCPADGRVSQAGPIEYGRIIQAKGIDYAVEDLLAVDVHNARRYSSFATIYLAPFDYHRVHAPADGTLVAAHYVPGDLFSVNDTTARLLPGVFRRNERLNLYFETASGPVMMSLVGALNVGSISTAWGGEIRPRKDGIVEVLPVSAERVNVRRGDLLGWFNMGSTVIVLTNGIDWTPGPAAGQRVRMGEALGQSRAS